jgi:hypothetical protein
MDSSFGYIHVAVMGFCVFLAFVVARSLEKLYAWVRAFVILSRLPGEKRGILGPGYYMHGLQRHFVLIGASFC